MPFCLSSPPPERQLSWVLYSACHWEWLCHPRVLSIVWWRLNKHACLPSCFLSDGPASGQRAYSSVVWHRTISPKPCHSDTLLYWNKAASNEREGEKHDKMKCTERKTLIVCWRASSLLAWAVTMFNKLSPFGHDGQLDYKAALTKTFLICKLCGSRSAVCVM